MTVAAERANVRGAEDISRMEAGTEKGGRLPTGIGATAMGATWGGASGCGNGSGISACSVGEPGGEGKGDGHLQSSADVRRDVATIAKAAVTTAEQKVDRNDRLKLGLVADNSDGGGGMADTGRTPYLTPRACATQ